MLRPPTTTLEKENRVKRSSDPLPRADAARWVVYNRPRAKTVFLRGVRVLGQVIV